MNRQEKKEQRERNEREWAAREASLGFYSVTVPAPPHPHTAVGVVAGYRRESPTQAVVSMQEEARELGADGVLGVSIIAVGTTTSLYIAYGTAVRWAQSE
ncbi:heavy metal-binding domain-containing protein [Streptomyces sp. NPDC050848]|uniref:heavy metal-binding domain-containing protein n=1 Tax=Streptomyces sp. NPDC050848 TaxID=3155791 RepID=UPI0033CB07A0